jgi:hypothetical protein
MIDVCFSFCLSFTVTVKGIIKLDECPSLLQSSTPAVVVPCCAMCIIGFSVCCAEHPQSVLLQLRCRQNLVCVCVCVQYFFSTLRSCMYVCACAHVSMSVYLLVSLFAVFCSCNRLDCCQQRNGDEDTVICWTFVSVVYHLSLALPLLPSLLSNCMRVDLNLFFPSK